MSARWLRRIQDPVHGLMEFAGLETVIIDVLATPEVARLKELKHLEMVDRVYPAAEHSRLVHALGSANVALRLGRQLQRDQSGLLAPSLLPSRYAIRDIGLAALLHDIGHGPLSHVWEAAVIKVSENPVRRCIDAYGISERLALSTAETRRLQKMEWHQVIGIALILWEDGELNALLEANEKGFSDRIARVMLGDYGLPYLPALLAGAVAVDRADYIRRDSYVTGVQYGNYDLDWLISTCSIGSTTTGERVVGFSDSKGRRVIEQFLSARNFLYDTVYHHKTVRALELLLGSLLARLRELLEADESGTTNLLSEELRLALAGEVLPLDAFLRLTDATVWEAVRKLARESGDPIARSLAERLSQRRVPKQIRGANLEGFRPSTHKWKKVCSVITEELRRETGLELDDPELGRYFLFLDSDWGPMGGAETVWLVNAQGEATEATVDQLIGERKAPPPRAFVVEEAFSRVSAELLE